MNVKKRIKKIEQHLHTILDRIEMIEDDMEDTIIRPILPLFDSGNPDLSGQIRIEFCGAGGGGGGYDSRVFDSLVEAHEKALEDAFINGTGKPTLILPESEVKVEKVDLTGYADACAIQCGPSNGTLRLKIQRRADGKRWLWNVEEYQGEWMQEVYGNPDEYFLPSGTAKTYEDAAEAGRRALQRRADKQRGDAITEARHDLSIAYEYPNGF